MSNFTHLHLHSEYSLLDGVMKIKSLAKKLKELNMTSVALTDHGNMFGAMEFYTTMLEEGIKPILGMETYIHNDDDLSVKNHERFHLCLFAKNLTGYKNLMYLSSQAYLNGFYYKPRINKKLLREHSEGLICSSACLQGEVNYHLNTIGKKNVNARGFEYAKEVALEYKDIFGDDFYLEIMRHGIDDQMFIDEQVIDIARQTGIKLIATNDAHYVAKDMAISQEITFAVLQGTTLNDKNRRRHTVFEFYVKSSDQMSRNFADIPELIQNTQEIADKCDVLLDLKSIEVKNKITGETIIPYSAPTPPSFKFTQDYAKAEGLDFSDDESYFRHKCKDGLKERLKNVEESKHQIYQERLEYEMSVISEMKFPGYMLIVWDFVREAKKQRIPVGPGRGSAAGSLVAFCLKITDIDPIKHTLLFERFLNPERVSMPDIDMDFCQERRGDIIEYVSDKYGRNNVAHVVTFNSMLAKSVIRDVARFFEVEYKKADDFAKLIPNKLKIQLQTGTEGVDKEKWGAFELEPKIGETINNDQMLKKVWDISLTIENQKRNAGTHAAAIVIDSEEELWNKIPLCIIGDKVATQYSMNYLEMVNLIKFDFLGLKTLTVIQKTLDLIGKNIDFNTIDLNDENVYKTIQNGDTTGMFQIESSGMRALNKRLRTSCFDDLVAVLALFRPGPMESGMVDDFIDRKHGIKSIEYPFKELEEILKSTYGVIVYQEQVMQIVQVIGGFSLGGADLVRRAMGKKKEEEMIRLKGEFADGAESKGFDRKKAEDLWDLILKFAGYGFNKSHSAAYAMITFQTAYLKTYYKHEFMAALLSSEKNNVDKINQYIQECRNMDIEVLPPHLNLSEFDFSVVEVGGEKKIVFGFSAIKGIGENPIQEILRLRKNGEFKKLEDFLGKADSKVINKKVVDSLAKSGSIKNLGYSLKSIVENVDDITALIRDNTKGLELLNAQDSLFAGLEIPQDENFSLNIEDNGEYSKAELLDFEYEMLGIFMSGNPLDEYIKQIDKIKGVVFSNELNRLEDNSKALIVGIVKDIKYRVSKKGNRFADVLVVDKMGNVSIQVFEKDLIQLENATTDKPVCLQCRANMRDDTISLRLERICEIESANELRVYPKFKENSEDSMDTPNFKEGADSVASIVADFYLDLPCNISYASLKEIQNLAIENSGAERLVITLKDEDSVYKMFSSYKINENFKKKVKNIA